MALATPASVAHVLVDPPDVPSPAYFTSAQWRAWYALIDAVLPSIVAGDESTVDSSPKTQRQMPQGELDALYTKVCATNAKPPSRERFAALLKESASGTQAIRDNSTSTLSALPPASIKQLAGVLNLLSSSLGSLALTGYARPIFDIPLAQREAVVQSWTKSWVPQLRALGKSITTISQKLYAQGSPAFLELGGWTSLPEDYSAGPDAEYRSAFKQFPKGDGSDVIVETDVVVVGSGCGGGVAAKVLSEAGHRVVVVDKGLYFPPSQLPMEDTTAEAFLFDRDVVITEDGSMHIVTGGAWGGGGTVNWGVSLKTPEYVLRDWAENRGLAFFKSDAYQESMQRVCDFMGVSDEFVRQNHRGNVILAGSKKLGYKAKPTPHNSGGKDHYCGHCHLGCGSGQKQGPAVSWLPAAHRAGAEFIEGFKVDKVTFEAFGTAAQHASGVSGTWTSRDDKIVRRVVVKAKTVIISGGSFQSPVLLRKSGLSNPQIGRNLYLHPVNSVTSFWKEEVKPWEGCAISSVCTEFEDLDGKGHGIKIEPASMVPYLCLTMMPWLDGLDFKLAALRYRHMNTFIVIARDRDPGYVLPDPATGKPKVTYSPSPADQAHVLEGLVATARICYVEGAEEIRPNIPSVAPFVRSAFEQSEVDANFEQWIKALRRSGTSLDACWSCAHQMGSNRMSLEAKDGVVDPSGKVWGVGGLYVADASVLPSATGVNPMISNMALADWIAQGIVRDLKEQQV